MDGVTVQTQTDFELDYNHLDRTNENDNSYFSHNDQTNTTINQQDITPKEEPINITIEKRESIFPEIDQRFQRRGIRLTQSKKNRVSIK